MCSLYSFRPCKLLELSSFGSSSLDVVSNFSALCYANGWHLRILLVQRPFTSLLEIDIEDVIVPLARDHHDLRPIVTQCDDSPHRTS